MVIWLLTLLFGSGANITPVPVHIPPGETFFVAPRALVPVSDAMRVEIGIGTSNAETRKEVLSGALTLHDIGDVKVAVCRSNTDCLALSYTGTYFSEESYGFSFEGNGPQFESSRFVEVRVTVDRTLEKTVIHWSNYTQ